MSSKSTVRIMSYVIIICVFSWAIFGITASLAGNEELVDYKNIFDGVAEIGWILGICSAVGIAGIVLFIKFT